MSKRDIRRKMLEIRNSIAESVRKMKDRKIAVAVADFLMKKGYKGILLYASFGSEVDTWGIFEFCIKNNIKTAFPKVANDKLDLFWVEKVGQLSPGFKSILEPITSERASLAQVDAILVPGVAFDENCYRIGYGGGFYDRLLLKRTAFAIGIAYEEQIVDKIPHESFDQRVDMIITDERSISCV